MTDSDPKHAVSKAIEDYISSLEQKRVNPDHFSCDYAIRAISAFHQRLLDQAKLDIARAAMPADHRSPQDVAAVPDRYQTLTTAELRKQWDARKST